jgi:ssDNA-binding Zn-finger/Zn-ribbon topoisomerase 1
VSGITVSTTKWECPICGQLRRVRNVASKGVKSIRLLCNPCGKSKSISQQEFLAMPTVIYPETIRKKQVQPVFIDYPVRDCTRPLSERHPICQGKFKPTQNEDQTVCLFCQGLKADLVSLHGTGSLQGCHVNRWYEI